MNQRYQEFLNDYCPSGEFKGSISIFGHSLGAIIAYDICYQLPDLPGSKRKFFKHTGRRLPNWKFKPLHFRPANLFSFGSPGTTAYLLK